MPDTTKVESTSPLWKTTLQYLADHMSFSLGSWFKIPVHIHWSLPAMLIFWFVIGLKTSLVFALTSVLVVFMAFTFVLMHEFGHALTARHFGIGTKDITLYCVGGIASISMKSNQTMTPWEELWVTIGGPAVNLALMMMSILLYVASLFIWEPMTAVFILTFAINLMLFVFNVLPIFPMDGGRILRSLLSMLWKDDLKATRVAVTASTYLCLGLGVVGLFVGHIVLVVICCVMYVFAQQELEATQIRVCRPHMDNVKKLCSAFMRDTDVTEEQVKSEIEKIEFDPIKRDLQKTLSLLTKIKSEEKAQGLT